MPSYRKPPALSDWLIATHEQNTLYLMDKSIARKISIWLRIQLVPSGPEIRGLVGEQVHWRHIVKASRMHQ